MALIALRALLAATAFGVPAAAAANGPGRFDDLSWSHRVLLVFSPAPSHPAARALDAALAGAACEVDDRDLAVVRIAADGRATLTGEPLAAGEGGALRRAYSVDDHEFAVLLIGKDGGEKLRVRQQPDLNEVFALIDSMPMRRAEVRKKPGNCTR